jgi:hypothetical protein
LHRNEITIQKVYTGKREMLTKLSTKFLEVRSHLFVSDNVKIGPKGIVFSVQTRFVCLRIGTSYCKHGKKVADSNWQEKEVTEEIEEAQKSSKQTAPTQHQHLRNRRQNPKPTTILPPLHQKQSD